MFLPDACRAVPGRELHTESPAAGAADRFAVAAVFTDGVARLTGPIQRKVKKVGCQLTQNSPPPEKGTGFFCGVLMKHSVRRVYSVFLSLFFVLLSLSAVHAGDGSSFFRAVEMDRPDLAERYLKSGGDPNLVDPVRGKTALVIAVEENSMRVFNLLVNTKGVDLNRRAQNGNTPLMVAAWIPNVAAAKILVDKGAHIDGTGWTALHYAAASGSMEIASLLLQRGAKVDALAPNRTTPLMMAARGGHAKMARLLLDNGADATLRNEWGMGAVDFARDNNHKSIEKGLQSRLDKIEAFEAMRR